MRSRRGRYPPPRRSPLVWALAVAVIVLHVTASAQVKVTTAITPTPQAGSLGTQVKQVGNSFDITGGTRPGAGPNLFHSFDLFSVGAGDVANFRNTSGPGIANIL